MDEKDREKHPIRKFIALGAGLGTAAVAGWLQGSNLDKIVVEEIASAIAAGDLPRIIVYIGIAFMLFVQIRGMRKEIKNMNGTIVAGFGAGEARFGRMENRQSNFEHRLTLLENNQGV